MTAGDLIPLKGWPWMAGGMLALVIGVLWTAAGLDWVKDSMMSDKPVFAVVGPVVAVAGLTLIVLGVRARERHRQAALAGREGS
ncbi:hypothetical protein [Actinoplanes sp. TFC3]|uniref:hypothetical protein n=1 Tax=Actinoplanes sp. TFC3 TaxID=1710355 RepID=UPI000837A3B3|nr:hypothetical protein [Actinoplanes sp. TFC3]